MNFTYNTRSRRSRQTARIGRVAFQAKKIPGAMFRLAGAQEIWFSLCLPVQPSVSQFPHLLRVDVAKAAKERFLPSLAAKSLPGPPINPDRITNTEGRVPPTDSQYCKPPKKSPKSATLNLSQSPASSPCMELGHSPLRLHGAKGLPSSLAKELWPHHPQPPKPRTARSSCAILPPVSDPAPGQPPAAPPTLPPTLGLRPEVENNDPYCD